jgi:predicted dehydrogenase
MIAQMKVLVVGCGSIGRRHIRNLKSIGIKNFILCDTSEESLKEASIGLENPVRTTKFKNALLQGPQAAVICTPSSLHLEMAYELASNGVHLLIEKPLSDTLEGIGELEKAIDERGIVAMMAMCYRFHPVFQQVKSLLASEVAGKVYHVNYFGGHYLPDWHPNADYRIEYAARKKLGGGVILTSIHGLDNIRWLFGEVEEAHAFVDKVSDLEMDVEDLATAIFRLRSGVYVNWQTDFLQRANQHRMVIAGSRGTIRADFLTGTVETYSTELGKWYSGRVGFEVNDMYVAEARHFLGCIEKKIPPEADVRDGHKTLRLALEVKGSRNILEERERICRTA